MKHESVSEARGGARREVQPHLMHNWGGRLPPCALGMLLLKRFMNPLTHAVLSCRSLLPRSPSTRGHAWCPIFFTFIIINAIIIVWIFEAINQSSQSAKSLWRRSGEEAHTLQTLFSLFWPSVQLDLVGSMGLFLLAISLESYSMDSRPDFALYLAYLFHKAAS